jgi:hypothetical protein
MAFIRSGHWPATGMLFTDGKYFLCGLLLHGIELCYIVPVRAYRVIPDKTKSYIEV